MANKKFESLDGINSQGDVTIAGDLAVNSNTLFANASANAVGIGKTNPSSKLDVDGTVTATAFSGNGASITSVNAVTVNNIPSDSFLRSDTSDTFSGGNLTITSANLVLGTANTVISNNQTIRFGSNPTPSASLKLSNTSTTTGNFEITTSTGVNVIVQDDLTVNGSVTATSFSGSLSGNASTATKLQTPRNIGGVSFDGSANINLPGVNTTGNQNTTGNAATATKLQTARSIGGVSFDGSSNINLPGVNTTGNQNTTGNAATATQLQTARTINGVSFNGTSNITLPTVNTSGSQTIAGAKTFTSNTTITANSNISSDNCLFIDNSSDSEPTQGMIAASSDSNISRIYTQRFGTLVDNAIIGSLDSDIELINYSGDGQTAQCAIIASRSSSIRDSSTSGSSGNRWSRSALVGSSIRGAIRGTYNTILSAYDCNLGEVSSSASRSAIIGAFDSDLTAINSVMTSSLYTRSTDSYSLVMGYGSSPTSTSNRTILMEANGGNISIAGSLSSSTTFSDFVEFFENGVGTEIEPGTIVTLKDNFVYPANEGDEIAGVVSHTGVINAGDSPFCWQGKYLTDDWGRFIYEEKTVEVDNGDGEITEETLTFKKVNPDWDPEQEQISRKDRPDEWTRVGLLGQVRVKVNSMVKSGDKVKSAQGGIGTISTEKTGLKCMKLLKEYDDTLGYAVALCMINVQI